MRGVPRCRRRCRRPPRPPASRSPPRPLGRAARDGEAAPGVFRGDGRSASRLRRRVAGGRVGAAALVGRVLSSWRRSPSPLPSPSAEARAAIPGGRSAPGGAERGRASRGVGVACRTRRGRRHGYGSVRRRAGAPRRRCFRAGCSARDLDGGEPAHARGRVAEAGRHTPFPRRLPRSCLPPPPLRRRRPTREIAACSSAALVATRRRSALASRAGLAVPLRAEAAPATAALSAALTDRSPDVRWRSAEALGLIGPAARDAVPALARAVSDPDPLVQTEVDQGPRSPRTRVGGGGFRAGCRGSGATTCRSAARRRALSPASGPPPSRP